MNANGQRIFEIAKAIQLPMNDKEYFAQFNGHHVCTECESEEIPMSSMDGGEVGLTDYFFSCCKCDFSWYVAIRTEEHEDGPSVVVEYVGPFYN